MSWALNAFEDSCCRTCSTAEEHCTIRAVRCIVKWCEGVDGAPSKWLMKVLIIAMADHFGEVEAAAMR